MNALPQEQNACWQIEAILPISDAIALSDSLDEFGYTSSCFENEDNNRLWHLRLFVDTEDELIQAQNHITSNAYDLDIPLNISTTLLENLDWVTETQKRFKPFSVGRFFIHSSYYKDHETKANQIAIEIDAKMAFGTGEHETTTGCMQAINQLMDKKRSFNTILDMGCGSAILAIAAAKLWPKAKLVAADIEPASVAVAKENMVINHIHNKTIIVESDGYEAREVGKNAPYDLILCNILATPLVVLAGALKSHLAEGGIAILSGLLASQKREVLHAHEEHGLKLIAEYPIGKWQTLVLKG